MKNDVAILMATYNGEKYLKEQIDSIINQTYKKWVLDVYKRQLCMLVFIIYANSNVDSISINVKAKG